LARSITHVRDFYDWDEEKLKTLDDVGPKVASSIVYFFASPENRHIIDLLEEMGINLINQQTQQIQAGGAFEGKTFLFTGTLSQMKRSEAEAKAEAKGATLLSGVSSKLNYLVVGEDSGSKLDKAKKLGTITILSEGEFLAMLAE